MCYDIGGTAGSISEHHNASTSSLESFSPPCRLQGIRHQTPKLEPTSNLGLLSVICDSPLPIHTAPTPTNDCPHSCGPQL